MQTRSSNKRAREASEEEASFPNRMLMHLLCNDSDDVAAIRDLLDMGADPNFRKDGNAPLEHAAGLTAYNDEEAAKNVEIVRLLLDRGADVNSKDQDGVTPLMCVRDVKIAELLISRGADVKAKSKDGRTALSRQSAYNDALTVLLIEHGADVNCKDEYGRTMLHKLGSVDEINKMLDMGFNVNAKDRDGCTPVERAIGRRDAAATKLLLSRGAVLDKNPLRQLNVSEREFEIVKIVVKHMLTL